MQKDKKIDIKKIIAQKEIELKQWYDTHLKRQKLWKISLWALIARWRILFPKTDVLMSVSKRDTYYC